MELKAPNIDFSIRYSQQFPLINDPSCIEKLSSVFNLMCGLEKQGDDEWRSLWIEADISYFQQWVRKS